MRIILYLLFCILLASCLPTRSIVYNLPKIKTNNVFPQVQVQADPQPFHFVTNIDTSFGKKYKLANLFNLFEQTDFEKALKGKDTRAFLVIHKDTIIYEKYFKGKDQNSYLTSFSMAKSIVSTLVGIAISEGKIQNTREPFCKYFPEIDCEKFGNVTIEHLLQHTSGIKYNGLIKLYYGKNLAKKVLPKGFNDEPGTRFYYDNANSQILGMLIEKVYQKPVYEVWEEKVWSKIGTEQPIHWAVDSKKTQQAKTFCCVDATARDFAKLGRVWMNDGKYNDLQIVPKFWLDTIRTPRISEGAAINYKYHFWRAPSAYNCFTAAGMYGQLIFMCPEKDLMFIRLGEKTNLQMDDKFWIPVFLQLIDQMEVDGRFE